MLPHVVLTSKQLQFELRTKLDTTKLMWELNPLPKRAAGVSTQHAAEGGVLLPILLTNTLFLLRRRLRALPACMLRVYRLSICMIPAYPVGSFFQTSSRGSALFFERMPRVKSDRHSERPFSKTFYDRTVGRSFALVFTVRVAGEIAAGSRYKCGCGLRPRGDSRFGKRPE